MVVRGGSVRGGSHAALVAAGGSKAVAEGAVLQARPVQGQAGSPSAVLVRVRGTMAVLRRCELLSDAGHHSILVVSGARATAADCACGSGVAVMCQGRLLWVNGAHRATRQAATPPSMMPSTPPPNLGLKKRR